MYEEIKSTWKIFQIQIDIKGVNYRTTRIIRKWMWIANERSKRLERRVKFQSFQYKFHNYHARCIYISWWILESNVSSSSELRVFNMHAIHILDAINLTRRWMRNFHSFLRYLSFPGYPLWVSYQILNQTSIRLPIPLSLYEYNWSSLLFLNHFWTWFIILIWYLILKEELKNLW